MHIPTIEDDFDYQFKKVIKDMKEIHPELVELSSEDLQDTIWNNKDMCEEFAHKILEIAYEYGADEIFEIE